MFQLRTDLALEAREIYQEEKNEEIPGVAIDNEEIGDVIVTRVEVLDDEGAQIIGKPRGKYITLESASLRKADADFKDEMSKLLAKELKAILPKKNNIKVLVVGLGNWDVTPDALGPKVVSKVFVTRHLFKLYNKEDDVDVSEVSAISPGVMGTTGLETSEVVKGIVENSRPDIVIVVDALASRKMERVNSTIQISTTGITPGSGLGNKRKALDEGNLGVPVIAIGVPTVVDAATLTSDTIERVIDAFSRQAKVGSQFYNMLKELREEEKYDLIREVLEPYSANIIVTPKEVDEIIVNLSQIIANGINIAVHPGIDLKDVNRYIH
ncbi:GPR endopeptidase [Alkaliphilus sp. B6464]|uniref:GPR endopeptidase n=1 Tax=Alkaliphilus sp. B6464 TaxID=2731219 RepID=UPI001BABC5C7|nr:GPR endopeptidase [Alkaliphilus sp. B6464]QUH21126.1 GPR endopeptidase [Alkaliphilus sp. B6464]